MGKESVAPAQTVSREYYEHLDALRGIAATVVALLHVNWTNHLTANSFVQYGAIFVDFFFVLSGIVISHVYPQITDLGAFRKFMRRRLARLYPLHLATLLILAGAFVALQVFVPHLWAKVSHMAQMQHLWPKFIAALFLLNAHSLTDSNAFNVPSWSIGAEMTAYLAYAFACLVAFRHRLWIFAVFVVLGAVFLLNDGFDITDYQYNWGFVRGIMGFSLGCITYALWLRVNPRQTPVWLLALATVVLVAAIAVHDFLPARTTVFYPLLFGGFLFLFMRPASAVAAFLTTRPLRMLGRLSYSIYMIHFLVRWGIAAILMLVFHRPYQESHIDVTPLLGDGFVALYLVMLMTASYVSYEYFEDPIRRRFH